MGIHLLPIFTDQGHISELGIPSQSGKGRDKIATKVKANISPRNLHRLYLCCPAVSLWPNICEEVLKRLPIDNETSSKWEIVWWNKLIWPGHQATKRPFSVRLPDEINFIWASGVPTEDPPPPRDYPGWPVTPACCSPAPRPSPTHLLASNPPTPGCTRRADVLICNQPKTRMNSEIFTFSPSILSQGSIP